MKKTIILVDGGHLRAMARNHGVDFTPEFIDRFAKSTVKIEEEDLLKILYYDARPYTGTQRKPVSNVDYSFNASGDWLDELAARDLFAVRLGQLKFRG